METDLRVPQTSDGSVKHQFAVDNSAEIVRLALEFGKTATSRAIGGSGDLVNAALFHEGRRDLVGPYYLARREGRVDRPVKRAEKTKSFFDAHSPTECRILAGEITEELIRFPALFGSLLESVEKFYAFFRDAEERWGALQDMEKRAEFLEAENVGLQAAIRSRDEAIGRLHKLTDDYRQAGWARSPAIADHGEDSMVDRGG